MLQGCRQADFRQRVLDITDHQAIARIERLGDKNPDRLFYLIDIDDRGAHSGFFALLNDTVKRLELARRLGAEPYIRWTNTSYAGVGPRPGGGSRLDHSRADRTTDNDFALFFREPTERSYEEILDSQNVILSRPVDGFPREDSQVYREPDGFAESVATLYAKYLRLRPEVQASIREDQKKLIHSKQLEPDFSGIIGVHVRGGDYMVGLKGHPKAISLTEYEQAIDAVSEEIGKEVPIFLATDDVRVLDHYTERYDNRILTYPDVFRSSRDLGVHYTKDDREDHGYQLGYEVLRDMDTLSRCGSLVAGISFVSFTARAWKLSRGEQYEMVHILNNGINRKGVTSAQFNQNYNNRRNN